MDNIKGTPPIAGGTTSSHSDASAHSSLKEKAQETREKVTAKAQETREKVSAKARETTERARHQGEHLVHEQKNRVAERIGHYGSAIHKAAHNLEDEQDAAIAFYTHKAADQLEHAAQYLRDHDLPQLRRDAEAVARRHQELFFGGLLVGGFVLARLLKASHPESDYPQSNVATMDYEGTAPDYQGVTAPDYEGSSITDYQGSSTERDQDSTQKFNAPVFNPNPGTQPPQPL
jgi:hypothetical protein